MTKDYMFDKQFKLPEDLGETCAHAMLDEIFNGGVIDATNQTTLLLLMALSSGDNMLDGSRLVRGSRQPVVRLPKGRDIERCRLISRVARCGDRSVGARRLHSYLFSSGHW